MVQCEDNIVISMLLFYICTLFYPSPSGRFYAIVNPSYLEVESDWAPAGIWPPTYIIITRLEKMMFQF